MHTYSFYIYVSLRNAKGGASSGTQEAEDFEAKAVANLKKLQERKAALEFLQKQSEGSETKQPQVSEPHVNRAEERAAREAALKKEHEEKIAQKAQELAQQQAEAACCREEVAKLEADRVAQEKLAKEKQKEAEVAAALAESKS